MNKIMKYKYFEEGTDGKTKGVLKIKEMNVPSEQVACDWINKQGNKIKVISISCRWCYPTVVFYEEVSK